MQRRALLSALGTVGVSSLAGCLDDLGGDPVREFPDGAGPESIDFSVVDSAETIAQAPREHWDAFAITHTEPPERRRIEGNYYVESTTGEVISELWHDERDHRDGTEYARIQPAEALDEHQREQYENVPDFVYDEATDAFYEFDPRYGELAPTTVGQHTDLLRYCAWSATGTSTHHGVSTVEYRLTGDDPNGTTAFSPVEGTLHLGVRDGVVYSYDVTLDDDGTEYRYTYEVAPEPFPDHEWVETARRVAGPAAAD